eukprot:6015665-Amphidinium_carterae.1
MDFVTHHRSSNNTSHQYSSNLVYDSYDQINVSTTTTTSQLWSTWMTYYLYVKNKLNLKQRTSKTVNDDQKHHHQEYRLTLLV